MKLTVCAIGMQLHLRLPLANRVSKGRLCSSLATIETLDEPNLRIHETTSPVCNAVGIGNPRTWRKVSANEFGISSRMISVPTRKVLNGLKKKGHDVYLVGGCVRDIILKRTPKDFDIITTADLTEIKRLFSWCEIVGRRFPICHVHIGGTIIEVSSFSTRGRHLCYSRDDDVGALTCDEKDYARWKNCLHRDFTINGLMYDPYEQVVYDYLGGLEDLRKAKVRTVIPASISFNEDCARILRAIRIAARLGFKLSKGTARSVAALSTSILKLDKGRIMLEMNYMLSHGSAEASFRALWKFGLLEILLPIQAEYFVRIGFRRRDQRSNMLLSLLENMDKVLSPDRPCHSCLWFGLLAFHKALAEGPRHHLGIAAFCLAMHNGGDIAEAIEIAQRITKPPDASFDELSDSGKVDTMRLSNEIKELARCLTRVLHQMTNESFVAKAMSKYPQAPFSNMVFIPLSLYDKTRRLFECVRRFGNDEEEHLYPKVGRDIDYDQLALGSLPEVRHTLARIVFDTIYPSHL